MTEEISAKGGSALGGKKEDHGQILLNWKFPEYTQHQRGPLWYVVVGLVFTFVFVYSFLTANFLFIVFLILFGLIIFLHFKRVPMEVNLKIFEDGLMIGLNFYEWSEIKNFRLVYRPPEIKRIYFDLNNVLAPEISAPLEEQDPIEIRKILKNYLEEDLDRPEETLIDRLNRWLKI